MKLWPFLLCLISIQTLSQDPGIDLLSSIQLQEDCEQLQKYVNLVLDSSYFFTGNVASEIENLTTKDWAKDCVGYPKVYTIAGFQKFINDDILASRSSLLKADSIYKRRNYINNKYFIRNNIFLGLSYRGDIDTLQTLQYFKTAKDIATRTNNSWLLADVYCNIGLIYVDNDHLSKAKVYFEKSKQYCLESNNIEMLAFLNLNVGRLFREEKKWDLALAKVAEAEAIFKKRKDLRNLYLVEVFKGEILMDMGQAENAIDKFEKAYTIGDASDHKFLHGSIFTNLGTLYKDIDNDNSVKYFELAFKNTSQLTDEEYTFVINSLTSHYLDTRDIDKFYTMVGDLSNFYSARKDLLRIEFTESNKREIARQLEKSNNEILRIENKVTSRISYIMSISGLLCLLLALYAYRQLTKNRMLSHKISDQNELLAEQNIELKNFAYMASHDLKAPARSISSFVTLLRRKIFVEEGSKVSEYIDIIEKSAKDMYQLVTSLLEFSNLENTKTDFATIDPQELFEDVLNNLYSMIELSGAKVEVTKKLPDRIVGDKTMLKTVFQNLINNAIKFVSADKPAEVMLDYRSGSDYHIFSVSDNGIGLQKEHLDKIFLMFQRLNSSGDYEGSGIGLSTCKKIVLLHNGKIDVESTPGLGSTFKVYLPKEITPLTP